MQVKLVLFSVIFITSCGGGGGGSSSTSTTTDTTSWSSPTPTNDPATFQSYAPGAYLTEMGVQWSQNKGYNGNGVTVAVVDSGLRSNDVVTGSYVAGNARCPGLFSGRIDTTNAWDFSTSTAGAAYNNPENTTGTNTAWHGSEVSAIIAGKSIAVAGGRTLVGIAPLTKILPIRVGVDSAGTNGTINSDYLAAGMVYAASNAAPVKVTNISIGPLTTELRSFQSKDMVVTIAAGNGGTSKTTSTGLISGNSISWGNLIVVGAVAYDTTNSRWDLWSGTVAKTGKTEGTELPGSTANYYICTPAEYTSYASPQVAAAAALIRSLWPSLSAVQTVKLILNTAKSIGPSSRFGKGLLDVQTALSYQNPSTLGAINGTKFALENAEIILTENSAINLNASPVENVMFLDAYDRGFIGNFSPRIRNISNIRILEESVSDLQQKTSANSKAYAINENMSLVINASPNIKGGDFYLNFHDVASFYASSSAYPGTNIYTGLMETALTDAVSASLGKMQVIGASYNNGLKISTEVFGSNKAIPGFLWTNNKKRGGIVKLDFAGNSRISFGGVFENKGVLGAFGRGAMALDQGSQTSFIDLMTVKEIAGVNALFGFTSAMTKVNSTNKSWITDFSSIYSMGYRMGLVTDLLTSSRFGVIFSQPLKVVSGKVTWTLPVHQSETGALDFAKFERSLSQKTSNHKLETFFETAITSNIKISTKISSEQNRKAFVLAANWEF